MTAFFATILILLAIVGLFVPQRMQDGYVKLCLWLLILFFIFMVEKEGPNCPPLNSQEWLSNFRQTGQLFPNR